MRVVVDVDTTSNTAASRYIKLGLLEISVKSKFVWSPVLNLNYSSFL